MRKQHFSTSTQNPDPEKPDYAYNIVTNNLEHAQNDSEEILSVSDQEEDYDEILKEVRVFG